jgi:hypothetical protein
MYDFATAITGATTAFIQSAVDLIDPTTFVGGAVTLAVVGSLAVRFARKLVNIAR